LGNGAKGLRYNGSEKDLYASDVKRLNERVRSFLPALQYAIPIQSEDLAEGKAHLLVLQAGLEELIIVVTNNTRTFSFEYGNPSGTELLRDLRVEVDLPFSLHVSEDDKAGVPTDLTIGKGSFSFTVPRLKNVFVKRVALRNNALDDLYR